jgi:hypothetical protein
MFQGAPPQANGFVDPKTIGAFGVATAVVFAMTATIRKVWGYNRPWVSLVLSLVVSFALARASGALGGFLEWVIMIANGCLLFCAVVGVNEGTTPHPAGKGEQHGAGPKKLFASFFHKPQEPEPPGK